MSDFIISFNTMLNSMLNFIYPNTCRLCSTSLNPDEKIICQQCELFFKPTNLKNWITQLTFPENIDQAYSGWYFNDEIQQLIHAMKYLDSAKFGAVLGSMLGQLLENEVKRQVDLLIAIPLHPVKARERGYNQAEWITRGLSKQWKLSYNFSLVQRIKSTVSQTTLSSKERLKNMQNAFKIKHPVEDLRIGIIDDVLTTGATISACAGALKAAGAKQIIAITCCTPQLDND